MFYLKSLWINFLVVFFVNAWMPGLQISSVTRFPEIRADLIFALILAGLNVLICIAFQVIGTQRLLFLRLAISYLTLNALAYASVKFFSFGIHLVHFYGYFLAVVSVSFVGFFQSYKHLKGVVKEPSIQEPPVDLMDEDFDDSEDI